MRCPCCGWILPEDMIEEAEGFMICPYCESDVEVAHDHHD